LTLKILLVDDDAAQVQLVRLAFQRWRSPYELHVSSTATDARAFLNRTGVHAEAPRVHIALVDLHLPGDPGFSVLKEIKDNPELRSIAVIVLSTSAAETDVAMAVGLHANAYLKKPLSWLEMEQLFDALETFWRLDVRFAMSDPVVIHHRRVPASFTAQKPVSIAISPEPKRC
jgi:CheY-like chemotaxis protein